MSTTLLRLDGALSYGVFRFLNAADLLRLMLVSRAQLEQVLGYAVEAKRTWSSKLTPDFGPLDRLLSREGQVNRELAVQLLRVLLTSN